MTDTEKLFSSCLIKKNELKSVLIIKIVIRKRAAVDIKTHQDADEFGVVLLDDVTVNKSSETSGRWL